MIKGLCEFGKVQWAHIRSNLWCLLHFGECIRTEKQKPSGKWFSRVVEISTGKGSVLEGTWRTSRVFYRRKSNGRSYL